MKRPVQTPSGIEKKEIHVNASFLGLVPVPAVVIDDVNIDFGIEVTDVSISKSEEDGELMDNMASCIEPLDTKE